MNQEFRVVFTADDYEATRKFYRDELGLAEVGGWDRGPDDRGTLYRAGGGVIEVFARKADESFMAPAGLALAVEVDDVDNWYARLQEHGVPLGRAPETHPWGHRSFTLIDPNGIEITLFSQTAKQPGQSSQPAGTATGGDRTVRDELLFLLRGGNAHMPLPAAVADFPPDRMNTCPPHVPYTPWHLLEHVRIAQRDILEFISDPDYQKMRWPEDYWPPRDRQAGQAEWEATLAALQADNRALQAIVADPATDLYTPLPHGTGQNILREILVVADHNAYHLGEFAIDREVMGTWPEGHK